MTPSFELRHPRGATGHWYGPGAFAAGLAALSGELSGRTIFLICSDPVRALHGGAVESALRARPGRLELLSVPDGEAAKTVAVAERLWRELSAAGGKRDSFVVAFGGGSVGDVAGFVAGGFLRGVDWLQVPTTLLAQVDAAVGGKTAVDLPEAKNAVGLFHHPRAVLAEAAFLATLSADQIRCGLVEAVKTAALLAPEQLDRIEGQLDRLLGGDTALLAGVAESAARAKAALVESDPAEAGGRRLLNLGHTLGHALESEIGHGRIEHGDAVAHGLRFAFRLSRSRGGDAAFLGRLERLIGRLGVPPLPRLEPRRLAARFARDKKAREEGASWVLLDGPGRGRIEAGIPAEAILGELAEWLGAGERKSL